MLSWFPQKEPLSGETQSGNSNEHPPAETLPHDQILETLFRPQETNGPQNVADLDTNDAVYDPFDGSIVGTLHPQDYNVHPEDGKLSEVAAKNEELWTSLSRILELQTQISRMHLDMEDIGMNPDAKGKGKGTRSRATSVSRVVVDDVEGDEGIGGKRDEEAEKNKAMEQQFDNLTAQLRGKKEAINLIMNKLDSLSLSVREFNALQAPKIDFPSRDNSLSVTATGPPTANAEFVDPIRHPAHPTLRQASLVSGVQLVDSPISTTMPLLP